MKDSEPALPGPEIHQQEMTGFVPAYDEHQMDRLHDTLRKAAAVERMGMTLDDLGDENRRLINQAPLLPGRILQITYPDGRSETAEVVNPSSNDKYQPSFISHHVASGIRPEDSGLGNPNARHDWTISLVIGSGTPDAHVENRSLVDMGILRPSWQVEPIKTHTKVADSR